MLIFENSKNLSDVMVAFLQSQIFRYNGCPDVDQLKRHSAAFFVNTDPLLEYPRALPPHVIPVGGLHIDHPKPLFAVISNIIISEKFYHFVHTLHCPRDEPFICTLCVYNLRTQRIERLGGNKRGQRESKNEQRDID